MQLHQNIGRNPGMWGCISAVVKQLLSSVCLSRPLLSSDMPCQDQGTAKPWETVREEGSADHQGGALPRGPR